SEMKLSNQNTIADTQTEKMTGEQGRERRKEERGGEEGEEEERREGKKKDRKRKWYNEREVKE
ncbi:hypothetical protein, partial [Enterobacter hormaechei]|uniref:hypothetical protein n=1 Tax=Enterobacter hormaechei TaxID=158836 RepID=UPI001969FC83